MYYCSKKKRRFFIIKTCFFSGYIGLISLILLKLTLKGWWYSFNMIILRRRVPSTLEAWATRGILTSFSSQNIIVNTNASQRRNKRLKENLAKGEREHLLILAYFQAFNIGRYRNARGKEYFWHCSVYICIKVDFSKKNFAFRMHRDIGTWYQVK